MNQFNHRKRRTRLAALHRWALIAALASPIAGMASSGDGGARPSAGQVQTVDIGSGRVGAVWVTLGRSHTLETSRGFVDLVVGDPEIADVMPLTDKTLYVLGKKIGTTNVSVYDAGKQMVGVIEVEVAYNTARLAADLEQSRPQSGARVSSANGRTVLSGPVEDSVSAARAVGLARQYGPDVVNDLTVRSSQQVMLEVRFVEASRNAGKELGINWRGGRQELRQRDAGEPQRRRELWTRGLPTGDPSSAP